MRPLVRSELLNKVHFHSSSIDYEKFYKSHIPKSHLPSDFGGDLESIEVLHQKQRAVFERMRDYFVYEEMQSEKKFDEYAEEYSRTNY